MMPLERLCYLEFVDDSGQTRRFRPNVLIDEEINLSAEVTEHPVETGANISDHNRAQPDEVTVELFFSDAITRVDILSPRPEIEFVEIKVPEQPLSLALLTSTANLLSTGIGLLTPKQKYIAAVYADPDKPRVIEAYEIIQDLRLAGKLVTIKTTVDVFEDMAIMTAVVKRNSGTGNGGNITLTLKKIRFVQSDVTLALPLPKDARSQKKKSAGNEVPFGPPAPKVSAAKKLTDGSGLTQPGSGL
jgi:hypothetical protein